MNIIVMFFDVAVFCNRRRGAIIDSLSVKNDVQPLHSVRMHAQ